MIQTKETKRNETIQKIIRMNEWIHVKNKKINAKGKTKQKNGQNHII